MAAADNLPPSVSRPNEWFTTTHWSVVLAAGKSDPPAAQQALERLCRTYWYPLYVYVRRQGEDEEAAKDLTQGFFARFLEKNYLGQVQREKGKFRSFLLASLKHFLADEWDKARAQKRGGGQALVSLDDSACEDRYRLEPGDATGAEKLYDRRWAWTLFEQAGQRLKDEYRQNGKAELYDQIKACLSGEKNAAPYAAVAAQLGRAEGTVKSDVSRLRRRFQELIREEVANTVGSEDEIDDEYRYLITLIAG